MIVPYEPFEPSPEAYARCSVLRDRLEKGGALRAAVVGAGVSGLAAARLLLAKGATVVVADDRPREALGPDAQAALQGVELVPLTAAALAGVELVVLSPGVPRSRPELADSIKAGRLVGEVELASWFVHLPMVGVTGTNGKSTTTALVAHLLRQAHGDAVFAGGNLGEPLSTLALDPARYVAAAVELSSYQLESVVEAQFMVSCWLNLTPDHTDRYQSLEEYAAAKRRLLMRRSVHGVAVLNAKDRYCADAGLSLGGDVRWFAPSPTSDLASTMGTLLESDDVARRTTDDGVERYRLDNPALLGLHNKANALAAIECARHLGVSPEAVQAGLSTFRGLPHRLELLGEVGGVRYYNDSKATNVDSAVTALAALPGPVLLIAGGKDKGAPWAPLVEAARGKVALVLSIGQAAPLVEAAFGPAGFEVVSAGTLDEAVAVARARAQPGAQVLLSPACASFDQFRDYNHRGEVFRALVEGLGA
ncbi:MAG: UDP-N-acetylmuramoyl-L-alanine--D-glutamate ligase [Deltaproteobacteria bacterium]|nr:UDP-N-acetylmuramoyl-L-alanine--D-glutamate ligase [Deltaproteobacteria bacterium]